MKKNNQSPSLNQDILDLKKISEWFENNENFDLEEGLVNVKEAAKLYTKIKAQLVSLENEFAIVKKDLEQDML